MRFGDRNCTCGKSPNSLCVADVCDDSSMPTALCFCSVLQPFHARRSSLCLYLQYSEHDCCNISCALEIPQVSLHAMFQFSYRRVVVTSSDHSLTAVDRASLDRQCGCLLQILSYMIGFTIAEQGYLGDLHI
jgi:hypothetical protein